MAKQIFVIGTSTIPGDVIIPLLSPLLYSKRPEMGVFGL